MKIRSGFVSNSSSSSFLIYGTCLNREAVEAILGEDADDVVYELEQYLHDKGAEGVEVWTPDYDYYFYVGRSWSSVKDNETGAEFKASVANALKKILGDKIELATHNESWYNG